MITHPELIDLLHYDPDTGIFRWRRPYGKAQARDQAGSMLKSGHRRIQIDKRSYKAHVLAWFYVNEVWPDQEIDHKNRVPDDNRIENLRLATRSQNRVNCRSPNPYGKGVQFSPRHKTKPYFSTIETKINGKRVSRYLGHFATAEEARAAYAKASVEKHGEFFCP